jgi:hypothetical protein
VSADLARHAAAQAKAEEIAAGFNAAWPMQDGPFLKVTISDPGAGLELPLHLATAFVAYDVPDAPAELAPVLPFRRTTP